MMPPVVLIDSSNLLHRFFHGRPTQIGREGKNVNAVRGLGELVTRVWKMFSPFAVAAVFDAGDSGRRMQMPNYKANREGTPPELAYQFDLARRYLPTHYRCDVVHVDGYEADDVLIELAHVYRGKGFEVILISNDKDLSCVVRDEAPRTTQYNVDRGRWSRLDEAAVRDRMGVPPSAVIDYLALVGDQCDNVPGVPGIGPKGAVELLSKHGSLEALLANLDAVERPRLRHILEANRDTARQTRQLLAPVPIPWLDLVRGTTPARRPEP